MASGRSECNRGGNPNDQYRGILHLQKQMDSNCLVRHCIYIWRAREWALPPKCSPQKGQMAASAYHCRTWVFHTLRQQSIPASSSKLATETRRYFQIPPESDWSHCCWAEGLSPTGRHSQRHTERLENRQNKVDKANCASNILGFV